jgi:ankyrin repeat protein
VNAPSKEGTTPVMLCALNHSNQCLALLLNMGAVDIHLIDANKFSAYQIALNCKN